MFLTASASVSNLRFTQSKPIDIDINSKSIDDFSNESPETNCFCFPITKVENLKDISGKSY